MISKICSGLAAAILLSGCVVVVPVSAPKPETETVQTPSGSSQAQNVAAKEINAYRAQNGLAALAVDARVQRAAELHARDMVVNNYFSHTGRNGSSVRNRVGSQGYTGCFWAENIGFGQPTAERAVESWIGSPGHRSNILQKKASVLGVGNVETHWVAVFAAPC